MTTTLMDDTLPLSAPHPKCQWKMRRPTVNDTNGEVVITEDSSTEQTMRLMVHPRTTTAASKKVKHRHRWRDTEGTVEEHQHQMTTSQVQQINSNSDSSGDCFEISVPTTNLQQQRRRRQLPLDSKEPHRRTVNVQSSQSSTPLSSSSSLVPSQLFHNSFMPQQLFSSSFTLQSRISAHLQSLPNTCSFSVKSSSRMHHQKSPPIFSNSLLQLIICAVLLFSMSSKTLLVIAASSSSSAHSLRCPADNLIHRLTAPNGAPVNRLNSATSAATENNQTNSPPPECECTLIQEGGWEVTCYATSVTNGSSPTEGDSNAEASSAALTDEMMLTHDYTNIDYNVLTIAFSVRHVYGRQLKITCDHGAPVFKPALFQGFGIESIDTFVIANCQLPRHLPLSVILYRTAAPAPPPAAPLPTRNHVFSITSRVGASSYSFNSSGNANNFISPAPSPSSSELVAPIRALHLTTTSPVAIAQLNTLLSDLESLEQLTLNDFNLSDLDEHAVMVVDEGGGGAVGETVADDSDLADSEVGDAGDDDGGDPKSNKLTRRRVTRAVSPNGTEEEEVNETTTKTTLSDVETTTMPLEAEVVTVAKINETALEEAIEMTTVAPLPSPAHVGQARPPKMNNLDAVHADKVETLINGSLSTEKELTENGLGGEESEPRHSLSQPSTPAPPPVMKLKLDPNALNFARILPNLRILRLRHFIATQSTIPGVLFQILDGLGKLEYLELDSNLLPVLPSGALSSFGHSLKKLYLYKNGIHSMAEGAFANLTRLEILDLSQNRLSKLPSSSLHPLTNLLYLSLRNNHLKALAADSLVGNRRLVSLDLSQNRRLEPLPGGFFNGLSNLANFSLAYCNLTAVSTDTLQLMRSLPSLSKLDLRGNALTNLTQAGLFAWNGKLNRLDLSSNHIAQLNGSVFSSNSSGSLVELNLNRNRISALPEDVFRHLRSLRKLSLGWNSLREISPITFIQLRSLEELSLTRNHIATLNSGLNQLPFGIGGNLKRVDLSYNNLTDFDGEINTINWHLYLQLAELDLKANQFTGSLAVPVFSSSIEPLIDIDLSSNRFTSVSVRHLSVEEWPFAKEDGQNTQSWETVVRLDHNPMACDCLLFPFLNYTKTTGRLYSKTGSRTAGRKTVFLLDPSVSLSCASPPSLAGHALAQLSPTDLVCPIVDRRLCPTACACWYQASDEAAIVNCDKAALEAVPDQLQFDRFVNISVEVQAELAHLETQEGDAGSNVQLTTTTTIPRVEGVIFSLRNNSITSVQQLPAMLGWTSSPKTSLIGNDLHQQRKLHHLRPAFVEVWLDHNNISHIDESYFTSNTKTDNQTMAVQGQLTSMPIVRALSLKHNALTYLPLSFLERFDRHVLNQSSDSTNGSSSKNSLSAYDEPLSKLYLGDNPLNCYNEPMPAGADCYVRTLKNWLGTHPQRVADSGEVACDWTTINTAAIKEENASNATKLNMANGHSFVLLNMTDNILCPVALPPPDNGPLLALSIVCVVLASSLFVVSVLYYRNKQTILAFIYIHLQPVFICLSFTEDDLDEDKLYDAFVSYSSSDRDIVMELIERLERPADLAEASKVLIANGTLRSVHEGKIDQPVPEYGCHYGPSVTAGKRADADAESGDAQTIRHRLCVHERDWLPGNLISWNIVNSVQNSKRTILVLSPQFIKSIWFQVEFHTAYYQMLEDKIDRLIVIVRGELPPREEMDKDLLFLLSTKTYLVWGEKWFWEKLYYAMPHKKGMSVAKFASGKQQSQRNALRANGTAKSMAAVNGKYAGGPLKNGGTSAVKNGGSGGGLLKWPLASSKDAQAEAMKEYVDKTIASHFQLSPMSSSNGMANGSSPAIRVPPKSLRNSGTPVRMPSSAYDNKSFITETNT